MSNSYTLSINSELKAIAEYNITSAVLNINNQASDEFLFSSKEEFAINSKVDLYKDNVRIFSGYIYKAPEDSSAKNTTYNYQAYGAWYELEEIVYQQNWTCLDANTDENFSYDALKSHVILGQDDDGVQIDIATQITNILNYAKDATANIEIGTIGTEVPMLYDETSDISCAQAIKRVLKWIPDASTFFDYSQEVPTLHILRRGDLSEKNIDLNTDSLSSYNISPRHDLSISGVEIKYEKTHSLDDETWNTLEIDKYPSDFDSQSKKALIITVELDGQTSTMETREVVCEEVYSGSVDWWKEKVTFLDDATNIVVKNVSRQHANLEYELISGSIPDWAHSSYLAENEALQATFSYDTDSVSYTQKSIIRKFVATNFASKTFSRCVVSEYEEPIPENLALSLYEALNPLIYDCSLVLWGAQADDFAGKKINLLNAKEEYASMQSPVMNLSQDLFKGTLTIKSGAPKQLYPSNIAEIFRLNTTRTSTISSSTRDTGKSAVSSTISINDTYSKDNTTSESKLMKSLKLGTDLEEDKIEIDSDLIPYGQVMQITKVLVASNGEAKYAYILMTEPKTQEELDALAAAKLEALAEAEALAQAEAETTPAGEGEF